MTDPVVPPTAPTVPIYPALGSSNFNQEAYTYGSSMPAVAFRLGEIAQATHQNAVAASERAVTASIAATTTTQQADAAMGYRNTASNAATTATNKAAEAAASALAASKLNLGSKATPPTTDNQGDPLQAGATYYDTSLGKWRVWTGTAWGDGISAVAGVASVNGQTGAVSLDFATPAQVASATAPKADKASPTFTGAIGANGSVRGNKIDLGAGSSIDCSQSNYFAKTVNGNTTLAFANVPAAPARYCLFVEVSLVSGVLSWPASVVPPSTGWPTLATSKVHLFGFVTTDGGAKWRGAVLPNYAS